MQSPKEQARELTIAIAKRAASGGMFDFKLCYELCLDALQANGDARATAERERCATVNVIGSKEAHNPDYRAGWFDGVEDCLNTIRALDT